MCPCPNSGKGLTILYLENIKDSAEYDKFLLALFEKNMAVEGSTDVQMNSYKAGADDKVTASEADLINLKIVCHDDKIAEVM